jgi:hypothetical protein
MDMINVASSNVASIGYDEDTATLAVQFLNGATYQYFDVPEAEFKGLRGAESVGKYLNEHIKGTYRFSKV